MAGILRVAKPSRRANQPLTTEQPTDLNAHEEREQGNEAAEDDRYVQRA